METTVKRHRRKLHVVSSGLATSSNRNDPHFPQVYYRYAFAFGRPLGRWVCVRGWKRIPFLRLI